MLLGKSTASLGLSGPVTWDLSLSECARLKFHQVFKLYAKVLSAAAAAQRPWTELALASLRLSSSLESLYEAVSLQRDRAPRNKVRVSGSTQGLSACFESK